MVYAAVREDGVYYQISHTKGELKCEHTPKGSSYYTKFLGSSKYYNGYAECSKWTKGNLTHVIKLTANGRTYSTDESTAVELGSHPLSGEFGNIFSLYVDEFNLP